jgi:hypothetical protein
MNQIKRKQYESINTVVRETKIMSGGLAAVKARFLELGRSYEQHLAMKNSKNNNTK